MLAGDRGDEFYYAAVSRKGQIIDSSVQAAPDDGGLTPQALKVVARAGVIHIGTAAARHSRRHQALRHTAPFSGFPRTHSVARPEESPRG
mgnify:CR=1 FL=1